MFSGKLRRCGQVKLVWVVGVFSEYSWKLQTIGEIMSETSAEVKTENNVETQEKVRPFSFVCIIKFLS